MDSSVLFSMEGSATRYPQGPPLAFQNVGVVGRRIWHFSSSSMRVLARAMDAGGAGRRPLQIASVATRFQGIGPRGGFDNEEVASGSEGPRHASLLRQAPRLLRKCCRAVQAGSLMDSSVLFSLECSAARYPPGPPLGKPLLPPLAFHNVGVGKRWKWMAMAASVFGGAISNYPNMERPKTVAVCHVTFGWGACDPVNTLPVYQGSESDVGVGWRVCHFSSSSMRILARGIDSGGGGCRPLWIEFVAMPVRIEFVAMRFRGRGSHGGSNHQEMTGGSDDTRISLRQVPWLLLKRCFTVHAGCLIGESVLFSLTGLAAGYI